MPKRTTLPKPPAATLKCVLLVVPEDATRLAAKWTLSEFRYQVEVTRCAEEALSLFNPKVHDVVVTADAMPGISGHELAHIIKLRSPQTPVVLLAGDVAPADRSRLDAVLENGAGVWGLAAALQKLLAPAPATN